MCYLYKYRYAIPSQNAQQEVGGDRENLLYISREKLIHCAQIFHKILL